VFTFRQKNIDSPSQTSLRSSRLRSVGLAISAALVLSMPTSTAGASPAVKLQATLKPETLGASTTVSVGFHISPTAGQKLPPLRGFSVRLPAGMGFAATTLGVATCTEATVLAQGPTACPGNSIMGSGSALIEAPFGAQTVLEKAHATIFMSQARNGHTTMLLYFDGLNPVIAGLALHTEIVTAGNSLDSVLATTIPPIPTTPEAPDVSMRALQAILGPGNLLYHRHVHGHTVAYRPVGLNVPESCPRGGFVFAGEFDFQDGKQLHADSVVPCPGHDRRRS
jgi:hypothetical protein